MTDGVTYILLFYLAVLAAVGFGAARKSRETGLVEYFLAGRSIGPWMLSLSLVATSASAIGTVSWLARVFAVPLSAYFALVVSVTMLLLMGTLIAPRYLDSGAITVPRFVSSRFGRRAGTALSVTSILMTVAVRLPLVLLGGSWLLSRLCGWEPYATAMLIIVVAGLFTIAGGLHAVLATHSVQAVVILAGAAALIIDGSGGDIINLFGIQGTEALLAGSSFPMFIAGAAVFAFWYWCSDQTTVQRFSGTTGRGAVRGGAVLTVVFLVVLVSVMDRLGSERHPAVSPSGVGELTAVVAGMIVLSAVLASVSMMFQSVASMVTVDILRPLRKRDSEPPLVLAGRLTTVGVAVAALLAISAAGDATGGWLVSLAAALLAFSPPVAATVLGTFSVRRLNGTGAWWAFLTGMALGAIQVVFPGLLGVHMLTFVPMSFVLCCIVFLGVSLLTVPAVPKDSTVAAVLSQNEPRPLSPKQ